MLKNLNKCLLGNTHIHKQACCRLLSFGPRFAACAKQIWFGCFCNPVHSPSSSLQYTRVGRLASSRSTQGSVDLSEDPNPKPQCFVGSIKLETFDSTAANNSYTSPVIYKLLYTTSNTCPLFRSILLPVCGEFFFIDLRARGVIDKKMLVSFCHLQESNASKIKQEMSGLKCWDRKIPSSRSNGNLWQFGQKPLSLK